MQVSDYQAVFTLMHLAFRYHLDSEFLGENNSVIIPVMFFLQPWIKTVSIYDNETNKIDPDLNTTAPQEPQAYRLKN